MHNPATGDVSSHVTCGPALRVVGTSIACSGMFSWLWSVDSPEPWHQFGPARLAVAPGFAVVAHAGAAVAWRGPVAAAPDGAAVNATPLAPGRRVEAVSLSPDGAYLLLVCADAPRLRLYDVAGGRYVREGWAAWSALSGAAAPRASWAAAPARRLLVYDRTRGLLLQLHGPPADWRYRTLAWDAEVDWVGFGAAASCGLARTISRVAALNFEDSFTQPGHCTTRLEDSETLVPQTPAHYLLSLPTQAACEEHCARSDA